MKKSVQYNLIIMVSSTANSPYTNSHRHTENLYILTAHPQTSRLQSNSKPSRLLPSQDGQQPKIAKQSPLFAGQRTNLYLFKKGRGRFTTKPLPFARLGKHQQSINSNDKINDRANPQSCHNKTRSNGNPATMGIIVIRMGRHK